MIRITCDRCERTIEVEDAQAGGKVDCPDCGDVNRVPSAKADRAIELGLPPADGAEHRIMRVHPSMFRSHPWQGLLAVVLLVGGLAGGIWLTVNERNVLAIFAVIPALASLVWLIIWKIRSLTTTLEVTNKRTIRNLGLLSKSTSEVRHDAIRNFQIQQTVLNRILGVGTIGISSAGQDGIEIVVEGLARPMKIRRVIDAYRDM